MEGESNSDMLLQHEEEKEEKKKHKKHKRKRLDVKMQLIYEDTERISPLVGYFPSGFDQHKKQLDDVGNENPLQVRLFRNKDKHNRLQLLVRPKDCKVDFVGSTHSGEGAAPQLCTYALGVLDKDTQSLKILPIASNKILRLEPVLGGLGSKLAKASKEADTVEMNQDRITIKGLNNLYGTKRSKTQDKKLESLKQKTDPSKQENLKEQLVRVKINEAALESAVADTARNIPPHDSTATTPEKAYPLRHIILTSEWDYLQDILELLYAGQNVEPNVYPSFVINCMRKLRETQDEEEQRKLAGIFSYITYLIKFKDQRSIGYTCTNDHMIPRVLFNKFKTMFTESEKFALSGEKINLLISYVLVLALYADGFRTDPADIAKDLRMRPHQLTEHFKNLGCKLSRVSMECKVRYVKLPLPLQFPKPSRRRK